jgi:hypothetical protein
VNHNAALYSLHCGSNRLTTLDISPNTVLEELECKNNLFHNKSAILGLDESMLKRFVFDPQKDL